MNGPHFVPRLCGTVRVVRRSALAPSTIVVVKDSVGVVSTLRVAQPQDGVVVSERRTKTLYLVDLSRFEQVFGAAFGSWRGFRSLCAGGKRVWALVKRGSACGLKGAASCARFAPWSVTTSRM